MTPQRQSFEEQLKRLVTEKKSAKGADDPKFVRCAESIIALLDEISRLPEDNVLTDFEVGTYCWAIHAVASRACDPVRRRAAATRLVLAFRKSIDSPQFWGDERSCEFGRVFFNSMVTVLYKIVKESNAEAGEAVLRKVGRAFVEILDLRAEAYLDDAGFRKDPVTDAQRTAMQLNNGVRPVRLKAWPSVAEKAFGLMNRCLKADSSLVVPQGLVNFLYGRKEKGDWLDFYCANAMMRGGRFDDARRLFVAIARRKPGDFWIWTHLAESCKGNARDAVAFFCRALICRIHDAEIEKAVKAKIHRQLAKILAASDDAVTAAREIDYANGRDVTPEDAARYDIGAKEANRHVFGSDVASKARMCGSARKSSGRVRFSGKLVKPAGREFGFVKCHETGDVFIPPSFAAKKSNGDNISGWAILKEDKKKKRMALCMISAL